MASCFAQGQWSLTTAQLSFDRVAALGDNFWRIATLQVHRTLLQQALEGGNLRLELSLLGVGMERRLLRGIINPAMIVAWLAGIYLAWVGGWYWSGWFLAKFVPAVGVLCTSS
jgi:uncharacterized membrane protein